MFIGISGKIGSGKTYLAKRLVEELQAHGYNARRASLSDGLKAAAGELFGLTPDQLYTQAGKEQTDPRWNLSPRQILQFFGTDAMRRGFGRAAVAAGAWTPEEAEDIWVRLLVGRATDPEEIVVVDDVRFPNEAAGLRAADPRSLILRLELEPRPPAGPYADHPSETAMDDYGEFDLELRRTPDTPAAYAAVIEMVRAAVPREHVPPRAAGTRQLRAALGAVYVMLLVPMLTSLFLRNSMAGHLPADVLHVLGLQAALLGGIAIVTAMLSLFIPRKYDRPVTGPVIILPMLVTVMWLIELAALVACNYSP